MNVPTLLFLPLALWPVCWMIVQVARIDSKRESTTDRLIDRWSDPTWTVERKEVER